MNRRRSPVLLSLIAAVSLLTACPPNPLQWAGVFGMDIPYGYIELALDQQGQDLSVDFVIDFPGGSSNLPYGSIRVEGCPGVADDDQGIFSAANCVAVVTSYGVVDEGVLTFTGFATRIDDDVVNELDLCMEGEIAGEPFSGCGVDNLLPLPRIS